MTNQKHLRVMAEGLSPIETNQWLCSGIAPRPIALVSTVDTKGVVNLAPFSFFNAFGSNPPMIAFAPNRRGRDGSLKHTYLNIKETKEFVVATVSYDMVQSINIASAEYPEGIDEFPKSGLTPLPSDFVKAPLVSESRFQMECKLNQIIELGTGPGSGLLIIGEVICFHVDPNYLADGLPDSTRLDQAGRSGGSYYTRSDSSSLFTVEKPTRQPVGFEQLPQALVQLSLLTAYELGQLANVPEIPLPSRDPQWDETLLTQDAMIQMIRKELGIPNVSKAWYWVHRVITSKMD